jgi:hypothetical protein
LGPLAVKTYPGAMWQPGPGRATFEPDYGRRGKLWVHGAFEPATGQATLVLSDTRDSASHVQLLEAMMQDFPADRWLIMNNLVTHCGGQLALAPAGGADQFIPKYACWLNLIEPWWKQLRSLALKGKRFETLDELTDALNQALAYWNAHRHPYTWKKKPQHQVTLLGGYSVCKSTTNSLT